MYLLRVLYRGDDKIGMKANADFKVISDVVKRNYNLCVEEVNKYEGYDDLNFKIKTSEIVKGANHDTSEASKREYVLKILNQLNSKNTESVGKYFFRPV